MKELPYHGLFKSTSDLIDRLSKLNKDKYTPSEKSKAAEELRMEGKSSHDPIYEDSHKNK
jgi:hypothetical protein